MMKKFVVKMAAFIFILLVVSTLLQLAISYRIKNRTTTGHDNFHIIRGEKNDIVFLGSSRCLEHYDPRIFEDSLGIKAINLGVNGHSDMTMQIMRLQYYLVRNAPPKVAVLNFDPMTVPGAYSIDKNVFFIEKNYFSRYAFLPQNEDDLIARYFRFNLAERYIPLYALMRYKLVYDCIRMNRLDAWVRVGYEKHDESWDTLGNPPNRKLFFDYYSFFKDRENNDTIKARLQVMRQLCDDHHIKLVCVQTPVNKAIYEKEAFDLPAKMCADLGITFIDIDEESIRNDMHNFANANHMNTKGVQATMKLLVKNKDIIAALKN
jgi:hypothetical protein